MYRGGGGMAGEKLVTCSGRGCLYCFSTGFSFFLFISILFIHRLHESLKFLIIQIFVMFTLLDSWNLLRAEFASRYFRSDGKMGMTSRDPCHCLELRVKWSSATTISTSGNWTERGSWGNYLNTFSVCKPSLTVR